MSRVLADHATLDDDLTLRQLADLRRRLAAAGPDRTTVDGVPVQMVRGPNGASHLDLAGPPDVYTADGANPTPDAGEATPPSGTSPSGYVPPDPPLPIVAPRKPFRLQEVQGAEARIQLHGGRRPCPPSAV